QVPIHKAGALERPGRRRRTLDDVTRLPLPMIRADVLDADDARFRPAELAPERPPHQSRPDPVDPPVEIVGGKEREIAAEVAVTLDDVVRVARDVLLVPGEHDQVVTARE